MGIQINAGKSAQYEANCAQNWQNVHKKNYHNQPM